MPKFIEGRTLPVLLEFSLLLIVVAKKIFSGFIEKQTFTSSFRFPEKVFHIADSPVYSRFIGLRVVYI